MVLGKVKTVAVCFDCLNESNLPVFSGGDSVSGRVIVDVTGEVRVKTLSINARGVAKVRWTESRNAGANTAYTQNYTEEVEYLNHYDILLGEERGKGQQHCRILTEIGYSLYLYRGKLSFCCSRLGLIILLVEDCLLLNGVFLSHVQ